MAVHSVLGILTAGKLHVSFRLSSRSTAHLTHRCPGSSPSNAMRSMCWPPPLVRRERTDRKTAGLTLGALSYGLSLVLFVRALASGQRTDRGTFWYCALLWRRTRSRATRRARYCIIAHCNRADCAVHVARTNGTPFGCTLCRRPVAPSIHQCPHFGAHGRLMRAPGREARSGSSQSTATSLPSSC